MFWRQMSAWMLYVVQTSFSGQATSPTPLSTKQHPSTTTSSAATTPSPSRHPHAPPTNPAEHALPGMNTLQAASRQATTHWKAFKTQIKSVSLYLPHLPSNCCSPPHQRLVCVMPPEHCCGVEQLVSLLNCISAAESLCGNVEYRVL